MTSETFQFDPLVDAVLDRDIDRAVSILSDFLQYCGSAARPRKFLDLIVGIDEEWPELFWVALHRAWPSFDAIPHSDFAEMFQHLRRDWCLEYMAAADRAFYGNLPDRFTAYPGQCASKPLGLSWTLDRRVAYDFARGHRGILNKHPVVVAARIRKTQIAGAYVDRCEAEVVTFKPPRPCYFWSYVWSTTRSPTEPPLTFLVEGAR